MRLFIALPLPHEVEQYLDKLIADFRARTRPGAVSWVKPGNIHITLRFLGETGPALVPNLKTTIDNACAAGRVEILNCDKVGAFPSLRKPNVLWVGATDVSASLCALASRIETEVREFGFEKETKPFKPHLTLGRVRQPHLLGTLPDYMATYRIPPQTIRLDRIVLFQSTLTPQGAIYQALYQAPLPDRG